jgi:serine phosphatase RsbU (regulator of sigma subunit)
MLFTSPMLALLDTASDPTAAQGHTSVRPPLLRKLTPDPLVESTRWLLSSILAITSLPAASVGVICILLLGLIVVMDVKTGAMIELSPLYFLPIIVASLRFHGAGGVTVAAVSAVLATWFSPEARSKFHDISAFVTNALTLWVSFSFVALITGTVQRQRVHLQQKRLELQKAHHCLQEEIRAAELLQTHLLRRPLPEVPGLEVAVDIRFARGVGGDFYDVRQVGRQLSVCVADVSGKGPQAALISAALRAFLDQGVGKMLTAHQFLRHLNRHLTDALPEDMFVTMFYGLLDPESGELQYASAGHDPPLLCRGEVVEDLLPTAPALGFEPDLTGGMERVTLQPGDTLVVYTDGLTTVRSPEGDRLGEELIRAELPGYARLPAAEVVARLLHLAYPGDGMTLEDDVAVLVLRRE